MKREMIFLICLFLITLVCAEENITGVNETIDEGHIVISKFGPQEFKLGDSQFTIQVENQRNEEIRDIIALVSGKGFSTYEVVPIDSLNVGEKGYILVLGNFKETGNINLTIRIENEVYYQIVNVVSDLNKSEELNEIIKQEEKKNAELANLSLQLSEIKIKFNLLEEELSEKKDNDYDVSKINLNDLRSYIRNAQSSILGKDVQGAHINLNLAEDEYEYQKAKVESAKEIPTLNVIKDNAVIFSTLAGAVITFFALLELLRRKEKSITEKLKATIVKSKEVKKKKN